MSASPHIKKTITLLNKKDISLEDRSLLISAVLTKLAAIPLRDIIYYNENKKLVVNGREVEVDEMIQLRESAMRVLESKAFQLIREQVVYTTFVQAAHKSATPEDLIMGKAAIWWGQQEDKYLKVLSSELR